MFIVAGPHAPRGLLARRPTDLQIQNLGSWEKHFACGSPMQIMLYSGGTLRLNT